MVMKPMAIVVEVIANLAQKAWLVNMIAIVTPWFATLQHLHVRLHLVTTTSWMETRLILIVGGLLAALAWTIIHVSSILIARAVHVSHKYVIVGMAFKTAMKISLIVEAHNVKMVARTIGHVWNIEVAWAWFAIWHH
jgi:hypothetical protein